MFCYIISYYIIYYIIYIIILYNIIYIYLAKNRENLLNILEHGKNYTEKLGKFMVYLPYQ